MIRRAGALLSLLAVLTGCGGDGSTGPEPGPSQDEGSDGLAPRVISTSPDDGSRADSITPSLRVVFSEPVLLQPGASFEVVPADGGAPVPGFLAQPSASVLTFSPGYPLEPGSVYAATLPASAVTDRGGNPPTHGHGWRFRTGGRALPDLTADRLLHHVRVLAHDSMAGRLAGTPAELDAARYVRDRFRSAEIAPGVEGYFQPFPVHSSRAPAGAESRNVIGVLPGRGALAEEWLVLGAHYDHLGTRNGEPYNGADDNASGTAVMLELARALASHVRRGGLGDEDRRSVLFHAYGAEEMGLVGSDHFCAHPTVAMARIVGMMNLDMVGRLRNRELSIIGPRQTTPLAELFRLADRTGLVFRYDRSLLDRSDQRCFRAAGVPVAFLHTGLHPQYHTVHDDPELVDGAGLEEVAELALRALVELLLSPEPVQGF